MVHQIADIARIADIAEIADCIPEYFPIPSSREGQAGTN